MAAVTSAVRSAAAKSTRSSTACTRVPTSAPPRKAGQRGDNGSQSCLGGGPGVRLCRPRPRSGGGQPRRPGPRASAGGGEKHRSGLKHRSGGGVIGFVGDSRCLWLAAHDFALIPAAVMAAVGRTPPGPVEVARSGRPPAHRKRRPPRPSGVDRAEPAQRSTLMTRGGTRAARSSRRAWTAASLGA